MRVVVMIARGRDVRLASRVKPRYNYSPHSCRTGDVLGVRIRGAAGSAESVVGCQTQPSIIVYFY